MTDRASFDSEPLPSDDASANLMPFEDDVAQHEAALGDLVPSAYQLSVDPSPAHRLIRFIRPRSH